MKSCQYQHGRLLLFSFLLSGPLSLSPAQAQPSLTNLVEHANKSVVLVTSYNDIEDESVQGTGFFIHNREVVTNKHVVEFATRIEVKTSSGKTYFVIYVTPSEKGRDLVRLRLASIRANQPFLDLASNPPKVGQRVVVIGNPLGLEGTVSDGIVSANRSDSVHGQLIQITAPISHGSSGSPILDMNGKVIGVATSNLAMGQNLNFALAAGEVTRLSNALSVLISDWRNENMKWYARMTKVQRRRALRIKVEKEYMDEALARTTYYAEDGLPTKSVRQLYEYAVETYQDGILVDDADYDTRTNKVEERWRSTHDKTGKWTSTVHLDKNGDTLDAKFLRYTFDEYGNVSERYHVTKDGIPERELTAEYEYGNNGRIRRMKSYEEGEKGRTETMMIYDEMGHLIESTSVTKGDTTFYVWKYNDLGLQAGYRKCCESFSGSDFFYDRYGNLVRDVSIPYDGVKSIIKRYVYEYYDK